MPSGNCLVSARGSLVGTCTCTCTCLGCAVLLCFVVCLTLLTSFFLPSHLSLTLGAHADYSSRSVCLFVCPRLFSHYMLLGGLRAIPTASVLQGQDKERGDLAKTTAFGRYGVKTSEKANIHN